MRGTSNGNVSGNSYDRRRRRGWLVETYLADSFLIDHPWLDAPLEMSWADLTEVDSGHVIIRCCRCYRCGTLLTVDTVTVDRIIPGCQGGTYRRNNIRPACGTCNSVTGGSIRAK